MRSCSSLESKLVDATFPDPEVIVNDKRDRVNRNSEMGQGDTIIVEGRDIGDEI